MPQRVYPANDERPTIALSRPRISGSCPGAMYEILRSPESLIRTAAVARLRKSREETGDSTYEECPRPGRGDSMLSLSKHFPKDLSERFKLLQIQRKTFWDRKGPKCSEAGDDSWWLCLPPLAVISFSPWAASPWMAKTSPQ